VNNQIEQSDEQSDQYSATLTTHMYMWPSTL